MKRLGRRLLYLTILIVWFLIMIFPFLAMVLAFSDEIQLGNNPLRHVRFFLVQEEELGGIGIERTRPLRTENENQCGRTAVNYLMWEGRGDNVAYCFCIDETGATTNAPADICPLDP